MKINYFFPKGNHKRILKLKMILGPLTV